MFIAGIRSFQDDLTKAAIRINGDLVLEFEQIKIGFIRTEGARGRHISRPLSELTLWWEGVGQNRPMRSGEKTGQRRAHSGH
jgi:hypothetical protein